MCSIFLHGIRADPDILSDILSETSSFELHQLEKFSQGLRLPGWATSDGFFSTVSGISNF